MKLKIKTSDLLENLNKVSKALSTKNPTPTLSGIVFELTKKGLTLTASNSDIYIQNFIPIKDKNIKVNEEGKIIIPGRQIIDTISSIKNYYEEVNIEVIDEYKILIYTDDKKINHELNTISISEYPHIDFEKSDSCVEIEKEVLLTIIKETAFATSLDESRAVLTGINFKINGDILEASATDSYRLATKEVRLKKLVDQAYNIIIPGKNIIEYSRILDNSEDTLKIYIFSNKVLFESEDLLFQSRLISGTYPNTSKLIPTESILKITADLNMLKFVITQASIYTSEKEKNVVSLSTEDNELIVKSVSNEQSKSEIRMDIKKDNKENITIAFSAKYMLDALNALSTDEVELSFVGEIKPITVKNTQDDGLVQLVVPIRSY